MSDNVLINLAIALTPLSLVTIGGGASAVPDVQRQLVQVHGWVTNQQFLDAFAISRMTPGPGSLYVTLLGWQIHGWSGALVATLSIFLPTTVLILALAHVWRRHAGAPILLAFEAGLRPVAAGMVMAAVWVLLQTLHGGWIGWAVTAAATLALFRTRISPVALIGCGAAAFMALHAAAIV